MRYRDYRAIVGATRHVALPRAPLGSPDAEARQREERFDAKLQRAKDEAARLAKKSRDEARS